MTVKPIFAATFLGVVLLATGCARINTEPPKANAEKNDPHNYKGRDWCVEHGVPESKCSLCDDKYAAACKKNGDWCEKHDRPESQCFVCNPKLKEVAAKKYRAKYGKEPPPIEDEEKK